MEFGKGGSGKVEVENSHAMEKIKGCTVSSGKWENLSVEYARSLHGVLVPKLMMPVEPKCIYIRTCKKRAVEMDNLHRIARIREEDRMKM